MFTVDDIVYYEKRKDLQQSLFEVRSRKLS